MTTSAQSTTEQLSLAELIALGADGMLGGGIFSMLGLSSLVSGHTAPLAFAFGWLIAQRPGAVAAGEGGVAIGGDVSGSVIITGDENTVNTDKN